MLSLAGCVAGLAIAQWGGAALRQLFLPSAGVVGVADDTRTLGIAPGTVKSRLHRALGRLRAVMEQESSASLEGGKG